MRSPGSCALLTGSTLAQACLMPASRHFLAGNSLLPPLPPHLGPACLQPGLLSLPWFPPWDGRLGFSLPSSPPKDPGPPCPEQSQRSQVMHTRFRRKTLPAVPLCERHRGKLRPGEVTAVSQGCTAVQTGDSHQELGSILLLQSLGKTLLWAPFSSSEK